VADVRLIADRLFSATATNLSIPFSPAPDFRNTAFELDYQGSLAVTGAGSARTMFTDGNDVAELYRIGKTKNADRAVPHARPRHGTGGGPVTAERP
jgi:hypothetical protein